MTTTEPLPHAMLEPAARVIADSVSPLGYRVTTIEATMHRFVLAELNTHRVFSRSSASSRAIPVQTQIERIQAAPAYPVVWPSEQPGMQGGPPLEGQDLADAEALWDAVMSETLDHVNEYLSKHPERRLHKSLLNRLLEPFMWHTVVITSTEWDNFDAQRVTKFSPDAQPEFRACADLIYEARMASTPTPLDYGEWHLPYIDQEDVEWTARECYGQFSPALEMLKKLSVARVARISYLKPGVPREWEKDLIRYTKLVSASPMHVAPLEMVCRPIRPGTDEAHQGNFNGWHQLRHDVQPHLWDPRSAL